jgi:cell division septum initiation protein DivIVA
MTEQQLIHDLLAIIHGDGGHHREEVGTAQAIEDAIARVSRERAECDRLRMAIEAQLARMAEDRPDWADMQILRDALVP